MLRRSFVRFSIFLAAISLVGVSAALSAQDNNPRQGRKYKPPPPAARIEVTVLKADSGKPIRNAHVIFHPIEGDKDKGDLELKTNDDGKAVIDVIPIGDTVTLQVIADGFQTYGEIYKIDKAEMSMDIHLKRPQPQYSIYKNSGENSGSGNGSGANKSTNPPQNSAPPASGNKSSGSGGSSNASQPQSQPK